MIECETFKGPQLGLRIVFPFPNLRETFVNKLPPYIMPKIEHICFTIPAEFREQHLTKKEKDFWTSFLPSQPQQQLYLYQRLLETAEEDRGYSTECSDTDVFLKNGSSNHKKYGVFTMVVNPLTFSLLPPNNANIIKNKGKKFQLHQ